MKAGPFEFHWHPGPGTVAAEVRDYLAGAPEVQRAVARMARSEVKNYLAELAEEADVPFGSPSGFLGAVRAMLAEDSVIDTLPNGHTTTCTCPDKEG